MNFVYSYTVLISFLYFNLISCAHENINCNGTIIYDHYNLSKMEDEEKKLEIRSGDEINLTCQLDQISFNNGCLSKSLAFDIKPNVVSNTYVVNDTVRQLKIPTQKNKQLQLTVSCQYNGTGLNNLVMSIGVGYEPQKIKLKCILVYSYSADNFVLECEFNGAGNSVVVNYNISFLNYSTTPLTYEKIEFNRETTRKWTKPLSKYENLTTFEKFEIFVSQTNRFGKRNQSFAFNTKEIVVIPQPKYKILNITYKSVAIVLIQPAVVNLLDISYNVKGCIAHCTTFKNYLPVSNVTTIHVNATHVILNIPLSHSNQRYKIRIYLKLKDVSNPIKPLLIETFKNNATLPNSAPTTFTNGFEIVAGHQQVIIYWKEIMKLDENGPDFEYKIFQDENNEKMNDIKLSNSSSRLTKIDKNKYYSLRMVSKNSMGVSNQKSDIIKIPRAADLIRPPDHMRKTINPYNYILRWRPIPTLDIYNYTMYWCSPLDEVQTTCNTLKGHQILSKNVTTFKYPKVEVLNFAIAANTKNSSSGLVWFTCPEDGILNVTKCTHSEITINWTMPCHTNSETRLEFKYCVSDPNMSTTCGTNLEYNKSVPINEETIILSDLRRCTDYLIEINKFHKDSIRPITINARTNIGTLSKPTFLESGNITNTSIEIVWSYKFECKSPAYYSVRSNKLGTINFPNNGLKSFTIENLTSFSEYDIRLAVCDEDEQCSEFTNPINIKTKFGKPEGIVNKTKDVNDNGLDFYSWQPSVQNSKFRYYEIKRLLITDGVNTEMRGIVSNPKCTFINNTVKHICDGTTDNTFLRVINTDQEFNTSNNRQMNSNFSRTVCLEESPFNKTILCNNVECLTDNWSQLRGSNCLPTSSYVKYSLIVGITLAIGASIIACFIYGLRTYRSIKNVGQVSMPEGLESIFRTNVNLNKVILESTNTETDELKDIYCTYESIFSSENRLDETDSLNLSENQNDYLEYNCDLSPLPNPGNYVKLNNLQIQQEIAPNSGYTSISTLQAQQPKETTSLIHMVALKPQLTITSKGYTPVSALQHNSMKLQNFSTNGYISIAALQSQTS